MRITGIVCALALALMLDAGAAFAQGNSGCNDPEAVVPGPNGCNNYGLCKAYFAGSENGRTNKRNAPPFVQLAAVACDATEDGVCAAGGCECDASNNEDEGACTDNEEDCVAMFCPDTNPAGNGKNPSDGSPGQAKKNG